MLAKGQASGDEYDPVARTPWELAECDKLPEGRDGETCVAVDACGEEGVFGEGGGGHGRAIRRWGGQVWPHEDEDEIEDEDEDEDEEEMGWWKYGKDDVEEESEWDLEEARGENGFVGTLGWQAGAAPRWASGGGDGAGEENPRLHSAEARVVVRLVEACCRQVASSTSYYKHS